MMRALPLAALSLLIALPSFAAKPRVLIDAPPAVAKILNKLISKSYTPTPIKKSLSAEPTAKEVTNATSDYSAVAVIQAKLENNQWAVRVLNGADGTPLGTVNFKNAKKLVPPKNLGTALLLSLREGKAPTVEAAPPPPPKTDTPPRTKQTTTTPPPAEPTKTTTPPPPETTPPPKEFFDDSAAQAETSKDKPMALRVGIGFTGMNRSYFYRDDLFDALSKYQLPFGPAPSASLELYPAALFTSGIAANFGIAASFNYLVGVSSGVRDATTMMSTGAKFPSTSMSLKASAVGRIPLGLVEFQIGFGYALQTFAVASTASGSERPNIPNVSFGGLRPSLEATLHFTPIFHLHLGGAYQILLSKGEFGTTNYFPRATGGGADMWVGVGVRPISHFEIRVQGDYARYFFSANPQVGDPYIAGGALDQYLSGTISVNFIL